MQGDEWSGKRVIMFGQEKVKRAIRYLRVHGIQAFAGYAIGRLRRKPYGSVNVDLSKQAWYAGSSEISIDDWQKDNFSETCYAYNTFYKYTKTIYVIVPVFNGYDYLDALFSSIPKTKLNYKLIIVDDHSTDERIKPYLRNLAKSDKRIKLIENKTNLGFVKSVNNAFRYAKNHAALVNTDTEMPRYWLERLMYPVIFKDNVASSTPYTNAGAFCSFPNINEDNPLFGGLTVDRIDEAFSRVRPIYTEIPTGVGFCMGMNYKIAKKIGIFDEVTVFRGYGEENDWCQRAIKFGYKNVMVENLFVYHKHGGSFSSGEKKEISEMNHKKVVLKHPNLVADTVAFYTLDPTKHIREFVAAHLQSRTERSV